MHDAGLKEATNGFCRVSVLGDDGFEGAFLAQSRCEFGAKGIQVRLPLRFRTFLVFDHTAQLAQFFCDPADALADGFKFESELAALSAKSVDLNVGITNFGFEAACFAVDSGKALFGLSELIAQTRRGRNGVEDRNARFFLLTLDLSQRGGRCGGFLLTENETGLCGGKVGGG